MLDVLLQGYDECTRKFRIGESLLSFSFEDVALVLGLLCDGEMVDFKEKYLSKTYERNRDVIKTTLLQLLRKKRAEEENFVRLLGIYLMGTMLFSNTFYSVLNWIIDYVQDLHALGHYVWVQARHR